MPRRSFISDFETMVLLAVIRIGDEAYGVPVSREIENTTGRSVSVAAVYAALQRLESRTLVTSRWGEPTAVRGGRAKRIFIATGKGIQAAREVRRSFTALWSGLPQLKGDTA
jgi:PadR family transcriptional regulator, regulatory protein PadR